MFFFLDIPKWVMGVIAAAIFAVAGLITWLVLSNVTPKGGAVEYLDSYQAGAGTSKSVARNPRDERKSAPSKGFELQPGMKPANTVLRRNEKGAGPTVAPPPSNPRSAPRGWTPSPGQKGSRCNPHA